MKGSNHKILFFLILGYLFSCVVGFNFNLSQGFKFIGFWNPKPFQILDFALIASSELVLKSQLIGYVFYLVFGILCYKKADSALKFALNVFLLMVGIVVLIDLFSIIQDLNNQFTGRHLGIGLTVFVLGLTIYYKIVQLDKKAVTV